VVVVGGGGVVVVVEVSAGAVVGVVVVTVVELLPDAAFGEPDVEQADKRTAASAATIKGADAFLIYGWVLDWSMGESSTGADRPDTWT
jgi:hypothetical protein